jgi:hypothetical protein
MIAVGGFDGVDVSSTEFSMWQSPISDQASKVGAGECICSSTVDSWYVDMDVVQVGTYGLELRSWVSMTLAAAMRR